MKFYTTNEIAKTFNVAESTVLKWIRANKLKAIKISAHKGVRVTEDDLNQFIEDKKS